MEHRVVDSGAILVWCILASIPGSSVSDLEKCSCGVASTYTPLDYFWTLSFLSVKLWLA